MKQKLTELKRDYSSTIIVDDFNTSLSVMYTISRQKINRNRRLK